MALSEIEKLERRYAENPQGLTFAPLAEVHRKSGDVARALSLLGPGLELHPDYIPASIVLGRCHLDLGDLPAAETAFTRVLGLDGENVIALKALADISERQHHFDQAERWLQTLLSVDRSNDEARAQLERIETARRDATAAPPPPALGEPEASPAPVGSDEEAPAPISGREPELPSAGDETPAAAAAFMPPSPPPPPAPSPFEPPEAWAVPVAEEPAPLPLEDLEPAILDDGEAEPPPPGLQTEEPSLLEEPVEPLVGLIGRDVDQAEPEAGDFRVELSEDIVLRSSGGHEFQVPDAAAELSDRMPAPAPSLSLGHERAPGFGALEEPPPPPAPPVEPEPMASTMETEGSEASRWPFMGRRIADPAPAGATPTADETTATDAAEPLPALEPLAVAGPGESSGESAVEEPAPGAAPTEAPHDERVEAAGPAAEPAPPIVVSEPEPDLVVTETMAEVLLDQGHSSEALRVYRELEVRNAGDQRLLRKIAELEEERRPADEGAGPADEPPLRTRYTASQTGGQSLGNFFQGLLAARPPAASAAPPVARPAAAPAPPESGGAPTRPAADALSLSSVFGEETTPLPPAVPAAGAAPTGGVSFDEFYSPPAAGAPPKPRAPDPKSDDLDQFHAWLQNLKR